MPAPSDEEVYFNYLLLLFPEAIDVYIQQDGFARIERKMPNGYKLREVLEQIHEPAPQSECESD